jgi:hypothetical protein
MKFTNSFKSNVAIFFDFSRESRTYSKKIANIVTEDGYKKTDCLGQTISFFKIIRNYLGGLPKNVA